MNVVKIRPTIDLSETGQWETDNAIGRQMALEVVEEMIRHDNPGHLLKVVREMMSSGRFGGTEVGFFTVLALVVIEG